MADLTVDYRYKVLEIPHTSDGDTFDVRVKLEARVDFGFSFIRNVDGGEHTTRVRLADIDTWEKRGETLQIAKDAQEYARRWLSNALDGGELYMYTTPDKDHRDKMGNFRRYLAEFIDESMDTDTEDTGRMVTHGPDGIRYKHLSEGLRNNGFEKVKG